MQVVPAPATRPAPEAIVHAVAMIVQSQMEALFAGPKPVVIALTAGRDSRAVLACARPWADRIETVTVTGSDRHQTDTIVAERITKALDLRHMRLPRQVANAAAQKLFLRRGGHCHGDCNMAYHPSIAPLAESHVFAGGLGGEIARSVFRRDSDRRDMAVTPALILGRLGLPRDPAVLAAVERWIDDLPAGTDAFAALDLAYLELRQGPWGTAQFCADPTLIRHAPLMTYDSVSLMLALPDGWKTQGRLNTDIVRAMWPELTAIPYNTAGRLQDAWATVQRIWDDPSLVMKKLRKRFA